MKYFVIVLLFTSVCASFNSSYRTSLLVSDLVGSASNSKSIVVYGYHGTILCTKDTAHTWKQNNICGVDTTIMKVIVVGNSYIGILSNNYVVHSSDDGVTWRKIQITDSNTLFDICYTGDRYAIVGNGKLYLLKSTFTVEKIIDLDTAFHARSVITYNNELYVSADSSRLLVYNPNSLALLRTVDFNVLGLCKVCNQPRFVSDNNVNLTVQLGSDIYQLQNDTWEPQGSGYSIYTMYDNDIYAISTGSSTQHTSISTIQCYKKDLLNFKKINTEPNSIRYTYHTMLLTNIQSITKDILIAVGRDKTLYISKNSGVDWELISNFYSNGILYWYDATHGFACADDGRIYRTKDGGTTWLPQYYTDATIRGENGIKIIRQLLFEANGKGFAIGSNTNTESVSIMATQDFGDTYTSIKIPELWGGLVGNYMVYKILGKYIIYKPEPYGTKQGLYRTQIVVLDTNFSVLSQTLHGLDSVLLKRIYPKNDTSFYALAEVDYPNKQYFLYEGDSTGNHWKQIRTFILPKADDYRDIFMFNEYIMVITSIRDSTAPQWSTYYIRNIDINTGEISKEYFSENRSYMNRLIQFGNTWILGGWQGMFFTKTPENPASWVKDSVVYTSKQPIMLPLWCNNALAYFYYSPSDGKRSILKINYPETTTNIEENSIEELSAYNVYVGSVAPNPATEHANFHLYIDATAKNVGLKIYDIHGNEVADCTGSVQHISTINGWCDVSVSISNIPTGIYYARIQSDMYRHAVPLVILR